MRYLVSFVLFCINCGGQNQICDPDLMTKQGITVCSNGHDVNMAHLELSIELTMETVSARYPKKYARSVLEDINQDFSIEFLDDDALGMEVDGVTNYDKLFKKLGGKSVQVEMHDDDMLYGRNVPHEILHVYLITVDGNDTHPARWFDELDSESVMYAIEHAYSTGISE